jgi:hypothetical protein
MLSAKERLIYKSEIDDIDIAKVVHYMYKYEYAYTSGKLGWYELKNNRWIHSAKNVFSLRSKLTNEIVGEFKKMMKTMSQNATFATEHYHQERYIEHAITMHAIVSKLKMSRFQNKVLKACENLFHIENFAESLASNKYACDKGLFDLPPV